MKLEWLKIANNDLLQIYYYIHEDSIYYAIKTINDIIKLTEQLKHFPYKGRKIPEYNESKQRELIYKSYRIFYKVDSDKILIRRIWHSSRKLPEKFIS